MGDKPEYLVRGALLCCDKGSHPRRLNLPKAHGIYAMGHPLIHKDDSITEENISYFGICNSSTPPEGAEEIRLAGYIPEGEEVTAEDVQGLKCKPDIIDGWHGINEKANISGDFPAVTTESYLICACGGLIQPYTSGQDYEENTKSP